MSEGSPKFTHNTHLDARAENIWSLNGATGRVAEINLVKTEELFKEN